MTRPQLFAVVYDIEQRPDHQRHFERSSRNTGLQHQPQDARTPAHRGG
jgi:hypothetical protein